MNSISRKTLLVCAIIAIFTLGVVVGQSKFGQPKSLIHVVAVKWKPDSTAEQRQKAIDGVKAMAAELAGVNNIWIKTAKVQGGADAAFVIEFKDQAALTAYAGHPARAKWFDGAYNVIREQSFNYVITN
jgi:antibiotic biosynthesis monooxygenase (ABM) superfamily enzyme